MSHSSLLYEGNRKWDENHETRRLLIKEPAAVRPVAPSFAFLPVRY